MGCWGCVSRATTVAGSNSAPTCLVYPRVPAVFTFWQKLRLALTPSLGGLGYYLAELCPSYLVYWR